MHAGACRRYANACSGAKKETNKHNKETRVQNRHRLQGGSMYQLCLCVLPWCRKVVRARETRSTIPYYIKPHENVCTRCAEAGLPGHMLKQRTLWVRCLGHQYTHCIARLFFKDTYGTTNISVNPHAMPVGRTSHGELAYIPMNL